MLFPNQQTGRVSPLATRGYVAMSGNFGYELDLGNLKDEELEYVKEQIQCYKMIRPVIQHGEFLSDRNPFMKISRHGTLCRKIRSGQLHSFSKY